MIDEANRRVLRHLWETEDDRICSSTWRTTLTPEEEKLVNQWDEEYAQQGEPVYDVDYVIDDLTDEDLAAMELMERSILAD